MLSNGIQLYFLSSFNLGHPYNSPTSSYQRTKANSRGSLSTSSNLSINNILIYNNYISIDLSILEAR